MTKKIFIKTIASAAVVASFSVPAYAASIQDEIRSVAGAQDNIHVQVNGNTIWLTGFVSDSSARTNAERIAENEGYKVHNNLILRSGHHM